MEVFVGLLEAIVDRVADVLERVAAELDTLSKTIFQRRGRTGKHSIRRPTGSCARILTRSAAAATRWAICATACWAGPDRRLRAAEAAMDGRRS